MIHGIQFKREKPDEKWKTLSSKPTDFGLYSSEKLIEKVLEILNKKTGDKFDHLPERCGTITAEITTCDVNVEITVTGCGHRYDDKIEKEKEKIKKDAKETVPPGTVNAPGELNFFNDKNLKDFIKHGTNIVFTGILEHCKIPEPPARAPPPLPPGKPCTYESAVKFSFSSPDTDCITASSTTKDKKFLYAEIVRHFDKCGKEFKFRDKKYKITSYVESPTKDGFSNLYSGGYDIPLLSTGRAFGSVKKRRSISKKKQPKKRLQKLKSRH